MKKQVGIILWYGIGFIIFSLLALHTILNRPALYYERSFGEYSKNNLEKMVVHMNAEYMEQCRNNTLPISFERDVLTKHECDSIKKAFDMMNRPHPTQEEYEYANQTISRFYYGAYDPNTPWYQAAPVTLVNYWAAAGTYLWYVLLGITFLGGGHLIARKITRAQVVVAKKETTTNK